MGKLSIILLNHGQVSVLYILCNGLKVFFFHLIVWRVLNVKSEVALIINLYTCRIGNIGSSLYDKIKHVLLYKLYFIALDDVGWACLLNMCNHFCPLKLSIDVPFGLSSALKSSYLNTLFLIYKIIPFFFSLNNFSWIFTKLFEDSIPEILLLWTYHSLSTKLFIICY